MISMDRTYRTRSGVPVCLLSTTGPGEYPVVGYIYPESKNRKLLVWPSDGFVFGSDCLNSFDLVEVPPEPVVTRIVSYSNVYPSGLGHGYRNTANAHRGKAFQSKGIVKTTITLTDDKITDVEISIVGNENIP